MTKGTRDYVKKKGGGVKQIVVGDKGNVSSYDV